MSEHDNFEDDYEWQEQRTEFEKFEKNANRYLAEKQQKQNQARILDSHRKGLQKAGLDEQTVGTIGMADPESYFRAVEEGAEAFAQSLKKGRDAQGRFTSQPGQPAKESAQKPSQRLSELREKAHKQGGLRDDSDISDFISEYIGSLL